MPTFDAHKNFAVSSVATAPAPATTGLSLTVTAGTGALFPAAPFNCTVFPAGSSPTSSNAEIIRVTVVAGDVLTIVRAQEGSSARSIIAGDTIANTVTVKDFTDIETAINAVGGGAAISAGAFSQSTGTVQFSNSNGVSFGLNAGGIMTASVAAGGGGLTNINISAGTTSNNLSAFTFNNGSGVSFGLNGSAITASVKTDYLTTAMLSNRGSDFVQASAAFAGTNATGTIASNGISISVAAPGGGANIKISAGTLSNNLSALTFANSNGISFGLDTNSNITATVATNYQSQGAYLTTAALSGDTTKYAGTSSGTQSTAGVVPTMTHNTAGLNLGVPAWITTYSNDLTSGRAGTGYTSTTQAGSTVGMTHNTSGLSAAWPPFLTTSPAQSQQPMYFSVSNSNTSANTMIFGNTNGVSFSFSNGSVIGSIVQYDADDFNGWSLVGANTAGTNATTNASGTNVPLYLSAGANITLSGNSNTIVVSAAAAAAAPIGISAGSVSNTYATVTFDNSPTVSFGLGTGASAGYITASAAGGGGGVAVSVGTDSLFTNGTMTFGNANNHSFVTSNGSVVISKEPDIYVNGWSLAGVNTAGTNVSNFTNEGPIYLSGGSNISLSGNSNTIVINGAAPGGTNFYTGSYWNNIPIVQGTTVFSINSAIINVQPFILPYAISASYIRLPASFGPLVSTTVAVTAGSSSFYYFQSINAVIYSQGVGASSRSLQYVSSGQALFTEAVFFSISNAGTNESISYAITYPSEGNNTANTGSQMVTTAAGASIYFHTTGVMTNFTGIHQLDIPFNNSLAPGNYWIAFNRSTATTTSGGNIAITNNVARTHSFVAVTQVNSIFVPLGMASAGGATASTQPNWQIGLGSHTVAVPGATTSSLALSSVSSVSNFPIIPMQFIRQA